MPRTIQKKNNFNQGMVQQDLAERGDLELLNKSAALLENMTPIIYGGVRSRRGTMFCEELFFASETTMYGTVSSAIISDTSKIQSIGAETQSNAIGTKTELFRIEYPSQANMGTFDIRGLKLDFEMPEITSTGRYKYTANTARVSSVRPGFTGTIKTLIGWTYSIKSPGRGYRASDWKPGNVQSVQVDDLGQVVAISPTTTDDTSKGSVSVVRQGPARIEYVVFQISTDGQSWEDVVELRITENPQDFRVSTQKPFKFIRIARQTNEHLGTSFTIGSIGVSSGDVYIPELASVRTFPYINNNNLKYLIVLADKNIFIYRDGRLVQQILTPIITQDLLPEIRAASKDDTIVFTHRDMPPQRLLRIDNDVFSFGALELENIPMHDFYDVQREEKSVSIKPSGTDGSVVLTGSGFTADMVGQYIDNAGGAYCKIIEFISATKIRVRTIIPFYSTDSITNWTYVHGYEPVWSDKHGWPRTCLFVQQRLAFGGSRDLPNTIWLSRLGDYNNFQNMGNYDNDAIEWPLTSNSAIVNLAIQRNMHIFTDSEEWTVPENSFTPSKFTTSKMNENGCWRRIMPVIYENAVLTVEKNGKNLYFYGYDESAGGFRGRNISLYLQYDGHPVDLALEKNSVKDKGDFLYVLMDSGYMYVHALGLSENINAPCIFKTDGKILSVCAVDEDVYLIVQRHGVAFVERIEDVLTDFTLNTQVVDGYIDNLGMYVGKKVYIKQGSHVVKRIVDKDGAVEVSSFKEDAAQVGLPFTYKLLSNPIAIGGRTTAMRKRINRATVETIDTGSIEFNGQKETNQKTYEFWAVSEYENDCRYTIVGEYNPCRILSVQLDISYEG